MAGWHTVNGSGSFAWHGHDDQYAEQTEWDARPGGGAGFPDDAIVQPWGDRFGGFIFGCHHQFCICG
jgi:hypothetical protein